MDSGPKGTEGLVVPEEKAAKLDSAVEAAKASKEVKPGEAKTAKVSKLFQTSTRALNDYNKSASKSKLVRDNVFTSQSRYRTIPDIKILKSNSNYEYKELEYDFVQIGALIDLESFVARAFNRRTELMLKQGWNISSKDKQLSQYTKRRLAEVEENSDQSIDSILGDLSEDITSKSNAFLWKKRKRVRSKQYTSFKRGAKTVHPIDTVEVVAPELMAYIWDNKKNKVVAWHNKATGEVIDTEDMVHIAINRKTGFVAGTPRIVPVEGDIEALRKLEENIEILIFLFVFPIIWYQIAENADESAIDFNLQSSIDKAAAQLASMINDGGIVTPPGDEVQILNTNSTIDYETLLSYMKSRVYTGLGVSSVDMGEGDTSNRSTAETLSRSLIDSIKSDQNVVADTLSFSLFRDFVRESRKFDILNADNRVSLVFNEIDVSYLVKYENHVSMMYSQNMFTHEEARMKVGLEGVSKKEESRLFSNMFETSAPDLDGAAANTNTPANQHGTSDQKDKLYSSMLVDFVDAFASAGTSASEASLHRFHTAFDSYYKVHFSKSCGSTVYDAKIKSARLYFKNLASYLVEGGNND